MGVCVGGEVVYEIVCCWELNFWFGVGLLEGVLGLGCGGWVWGCNLVYLGYWLLGWFYFFNICRCF